MEHDGEVRDRTAIYLQALNLEKGKNISPEAAFGESKFDVAALENYISGNKENLIGSGQLLKIDLSTLQKSITEEVSATKNTY